MSGLTIGAYKLAGKDIAYIRALVRLFANTEKLHWTFAEAPPFDVVVTEPSSVGSNGSIPGLRASVLKLVDGVGNLRSDSIDYPIRADQFRDWLKKKEASIRLRRAGTPASEALDKPVLPARPALKPAPARISAAEQQYMPTACAAGPPRPCWRRTRRASVWLLYCREILIVRLNWWN